METKETKKRRPLVVIAVAGLVVVCLCVAGVMLLGGDEADHPAASAAPTATTAVARAEEQLPAATNTSAPTDTPVPTDTPMPTDTPATLPGLNDRVEGGGIALTVLDARREMQVSEFVTPADGNVYLVIEALIENVSRDEAPYNPLYFSVKDSEGFEYQMTPFGAAPALQSGSLTQGDRARGFVTFEVREAATGLVVTYEPLVLLGGYEALRVAVEE